MCELNTTSFLIKKTVLTKESIKAWQSDYFIVSFLKLLQNRLKAVCSRVSLKPYLLTAGMHVLALDSDTEEKYVKTSPVVDGLPPGNLIFIQQADLFFITFGAPKVLFTCCLYSSA